MRGISAHIEDGGENNKPDAEQLHRSVITSDNWLGELDAIPPAFPDQDLSFPVLWHSSSISKCSTTITAANTAVGVRRAWLILVQIFMADYGI